VEEHEQPFTQTYQSTTSHSLSYWSKLERLFAGRPAAYYRRLRTYYRRWKRIVGLDTSIWRILREAPYARWVKEETQTLNHLRNIVTVPSRPTIAVFMTVHTPSCLWLEESISSVHAQWFPHWELWLCVAAVEASSLSSFLKQFQERDSRIRVASAPDSKTAVESLNHALEQTTCEFIGLLGAYDTLAPHALAEIAQRQQRKEADLFYSDEDEIDAYGRRVNPFFKPDWSPDLCLSSLYACHFGVYHRQLLQKVGGFRSKYAACLEYDLVLRCTEHSNRIIHIPKVLYHKRQNLDEMTEGKGATRSTMAAVHDNAKLALREALQRRAEVAVVNDGPTLCTFHVRRQLRGEPLISIIIPTRDRLDMLRVCIDSIEKRTAYRNYELVIVDNGSREPQTLTYLSASRHRVLRNDEPFNFARLNNKAVAEAKGEYILLLNNDVEVIAQEWLTAMLEHAQRKEVGAVGAQLLYADGTMQHAGVVLGLHGAAAHAHKYLLVSEPSYFSFPHLIRNYSAVTAACLLTRKAVYEGVGGMDERLAVTFNDVDFCLRLQEKGYLIVYTPHAKLYHHESRSRWLQSPPVEEKQYISARWGSVIAHDPYYNPHLTLKRENFAFDLHRARQLLQDRTRR
jgi:GT2 family glycosyltransferase